MKRLASILLVVLLLFTATASVADGEKTKITLSFWGSGEDELAAKTALMDAAAEKFNVEFEYWYVEGNDYPTKLTTVFTSGDVPDIMNMANDVFYPFKDSGNIENLRPYMEADGILEGTFTPSALAQYTYGDTIYAAPSGTKTFAIGYNKNLFDAAGVAYPEEGWTVEDLIEKAKLLTSGEGENKIYGFEFGWGIHENMRGLFNNPVYNVEDLTMNVVDNEQFKATLEMLKQMYDDGSLLYGVSTNAGFNNGMTAIALLWAPSLASGDYNRTIGDAFDWDIITMPTHPEYGPMYCTARTDGWMMSSKTDKKDLVWEIIKFWTTDEECMKISTKDCIPVLISGLENDAYMGDVLAGKNASAISEQAEHSTTFQTAGVWGEINDEIQYCFDTYLYGDMTLDEAIAEIDEFGTDALNSIK